jgi:hypothetical protein
MKADHEERESGQLQGERGFFLYKHTMHDTNHTNSSTIHAIVGEPFTELIPHNEEHREWKGSQLAELL